MSDIRWTIENVPPSFWDLIAQASGDPERYVDSLARLSREEVAETYHQYAGLSQDLFGEDQIERIGSRDRAADIVDWVVTQGVDYYRKIYESRESLPEHIPGGPSFGEKIIEHYMGRFGTWIRP